MQRNYDLFELLSDGSPIWRACAAGLAEVRRKLADFAATTVNECYAMHVPTKEIVARVNIGGARPKVQKTLVAQIEYLHERAAMRTVLLRAWGFEVVSVVGNEAAKLVLDLSQSWNFFIVGHAAPREVREEMVAWLKARFPGVPILALNPPETPALAGANYNVKQDSNGAEIWLPIVANALNSSRCTSPLRK
jgi:hypothetical protein